MRLRAQLLRRGAVAAAVVATLMPSTPAHAGIVAPPPREGAARASDAADGKVVLFGGNNGGWLGDTWTWNGTDWSQQTPLDHPRPWYAPGMAQDTADGQVVL